MAEKNDLEATTEESIDCISSSEPEKSRREEGFKNSLEVGQGRLLPRIQTWQL